MEQYLFGLTAELTVSDNSKADIVIFTTLLSFAVIISWVKYCNQPGRKAAWQWKREKVVDYTSSSSWGQAGSATRVRLLKPINGMAWSAPMYHCSATLCITSRANSMNSVKFFFFFLFYLQWLQAKVCWRVDDFHLWFLCPFLMFTGRTCTQLNWGIIKQTHQTSRLLQCQSSRRKTLIKYVGSQTRWREATQARMCFLYLTGIPSRRWKVRVSSHLIHIQQL